jgi:hypothetical protein
MTNHGDDIAAGIGGALSGVFGAITVGKTFEVVYFAAIGGIAGVFAKKGAEWLWYYFHPKTNNNDTDNGSSNNS